MSSNQEEVGTENAGTYAEQWPLLAGTITRSTNGLLKDYLVDNLDSLQDLVDQVTTHEDERAGVLLTIGRVTARAFFHAGGKKWRGSSQKRLAGQTLTKEESDRFAMFLGGVKETVCRRLADHHHESYVSLTKTTGWGYYSVLFSQWSKVLLSRDVTTAQVLAALAWTKDMEPTPDTPTSMRDLYDTVTGKKSEGKDVRVNLTKKGPKDLLTLITKAWTPDQVESFYNLLAEYMEESEESKESEESEESKVA